MRLRALIATLGLAVCAAAPASAASSGIAPGARAYVSIIIDDMGDRYSEGLEAVNLPGPVACAFLPRTPHARELAEQAYKQGKEILLHLPMQSMGGEPLGPGGVTLDMGPAQFTDTVREDLSDIPHVMGVNNHMGSLLTQHPGDMQLLMDVLKRQGGLMFVDSRTTAKTVAQQIATENGVPNLRRNVFLDDELSAAAIHAQFTRLIREARTQGSAVAIGHPHAVTMRVLARLLPKLREQGVELVSLRHMLAIQNHGAVQWRASSSQ